MDTRRRYVDALEARAEQGTTPVPNGCVVDLARTHRGAWPSGFCELRANDPGAASRRTEFATHSAEVFIRGSGRAPCCEQPCNPVSRLRRPSPFTRSSACLQGGA